MHGGAVTASSEGVPRRGLTIIVAGMIAGDPYQGGATWAVLQYVLGLRQLGHDVYFIEPVAADKLQPRGTSLSCSANAAYFRAVMRQFDLESRAALLLADTGHTVGLRYDSLRRAAAESDCLINISGMLADPALTEPIPVRVYLDLDPGFNQLWHAAEGLDVGLDGHTHFVTIGLALGEKSCDIPQAEMQDDTCVGDMCTLTRSNGSRFKPQQAPWMDLLMYQWAAGQNALSPALVQGRLAVEDDINGDARVAIALASGLNVDTKSDDYLTQLNPLLVRWAIRELLPPADHKMCGKTAKDVYLAAFSQPWEIFVH